MKTNGATKPERNKLSKEELEKLLLEDIKKVVGKDSPELLETNGNKNKVSESVEQGGTEKGKPNPKVEEEKSNGNENTGTEKGKEKKSEEEEKPNEEVKTETRGRHKKDCVCENCVAKRLGNKKSETDLKGEMGKYKTQTLPNSEKKKEETSATPQIDLSKYISGALLLICLDSLFPSFILMIAKWVDPKYKNVNPKKLKLTSEEKRELEPLADEIVKLIFGMVHPAVAFLIATGILYGSKLMALEEEDFLPKKKEGGNKK